MRLSFVFVNNYISFAKRVVSRRAAVVDPDTAPLPLVNFFKSTRLYFHFSYNGQVVAEAILLGSRQTSQGLEWSDAVRRRTASYIQADVAKVVNIWVEYWMANLIVGAVNGCPQGTRSWVFSPRF